MIPIRSTVLLLATLTCPLALHAATHDLASEYEQVRKIAQRDPKVRAAYEAADRKLAEKIVEIDPALKGYRPGQPAPKTAKAAPVPKMAPKVSASTARKGKELAHVVAKGETLSSIASKYRVSVGTLKTANEISDDRKLIAGHVLIIPGGRKPAATAKPAVKSTRKSKHASAAPKDDSLWGKLKSSF
jgi:LysM repeat protein